MPAAMARIDTCPDGHRLKLSIAMAGTCDGCGRFVEDGERVQNCHSCNWYLCDDCRPQRHSIGAPLDLWGALANLFMGDVCSAPIVATEEIDYTSRRRHPKKSKAAQRSQVGAGRDEVDRARQRATPSAELDDAGVLAVAVAGNCEPREAMPHEEAACAAAGTGASGGHQGQKPAKKWVQPLDLLDELDFVPAAKPQHDLASPSTTSVAATMGGA